MLDLVFINNQAPALNADNMNRIVNEINKTDAKANDLQSEIATLVIEKGGSIVQANPEEIPPEAEELNRLRINDKVYVIATESLNARITELDEKIDTDVSQLQDSIASKVTQLTFETGIDIGDWEAVIDPDEPVIYERYMNYHDAVAKLSQQIDIMGARTDDLKTSLNTLEEVSGNFSSNSTYVSSGAIYAYKLGKLVTLNCHFNLKSAINSWSGYIFTSSLAFKVSTNQYPKIFAFDNSGNCYPLRWYNDGFVTIKNIPATSSEITILATLPLA